MCHGAFSHVLSCMASEEVHCKYISLHYGYILISVVINDNIRQKQLPL